MIVHLTANKVAKLVGGERTYVARDTKLKGFGCRVTANGAKSWVVEYRSGGGGRGGKQRRYTLAPVSTLSAPAARQRATEILAKVRIGEDVMATKIEKRSQLRFAELAELYWRQEAAVVCKASTVALYGCLLKNHVLPAMGTMRPHEITKSVLLKFHRELGITKRATANRTLTLISGIFSWAIRSGSLAEVGNPAAGISKFHEEGRERYLKADELGRLGDALRELESVGLPWPEIDESKPTAKHAVKAQNRFTNPDPAAATAVKLLLLTGCRLREILHLQWSEVDLERGRLFLQDSKTGRKPVCLSSAAVSLLESLSRAGSYVIPGTLVDCPRADLKRPWVALCRRAGLEGVRLHDLRHTFASIGAGDGLGLQMIGALLGHSQSATTARYAHLDAVPMQRASDKIGSRIAEMLSGKQVSMR
jgi:integrase